MTSEVDKWQPEMSECFGLIFLLERRFETIFDRMLASENITSKQWLVLAAVEKSTDRNPSVQEVAHQLSTSHQNIKAIALNLEKRGYLQLKKDPKDRRITRLSTTTESKLLWKAREEVDKSNLVELFKLLSEDELIQLKQSLFKLIQGVNQMAERNFKVD